jgi:hypothetical protein
VALGPLAELALGIRFDIDRIESVTDSGAYGLEAWKALWRVIDHTELAGTQLFEGDTAATLSREENVYCIALLMTHGDRDNLKTRLEANPALRAVTASPMFVEGPLLGREPLVPAGRVDFDGTIQEGVWAGPALQAVLEERAST